VIRHLAYRCWYFDCDPWEEPHFTTEAPALADEATAEYEYDPATRPRFGGFDRAY
jgi:hypothetical protein